MDTRVKPAYDGLLFVRTLLLFFALSKTLGVMFLPVNFLIELGVLGSILLLTRFAPVGRKLMVASAVLLAIGSFSPLGEWLLHPLESRFPPWDSSRGAPDGIVVLGGPIDPQLSASHGTAVYTGAVDRLIATATLARRYPNVRIIYSGGSANLISDDSAKEADYAIGVFESLGVSKDRLVIERRSRNTQENAEFSKALAAPKNGERWLLVTSAYHMPRSIGIFRNAGFAVEAYPVDWRTSKQAVFLEFPGNAVDGLRRVEFAGREWMGLLAYRITGRTSELLPAPAKE